jgi:hypothetical protein
MPHSADVAMRSAGRFIPRKMRAALAVWFPAIPTYRPMARKAVSVGTTSG